MPFFGTLKFLNYEISIFFVCGFESATPPYTLLTGSLEWFDSDEKVLFDTGLPNREILQCLFNSVKDRKSNISIQHLLIFRNLA